MELVNDNLGRGEKERGRGREREREGEKGGGEGEIIKHTGAAQIMHTCLILPIGGSVSRRSGTFRDRLCPSVKLAFLPQVKRDTSDTAMEEEEEEEEEERMQASVLVVGQRLVSQGWGSSCWKLI